MISHSYVKLPEANHEKLRPHPQNRDFTEAFWLVVEALGKIDVKCEASSLVRWLQNKNDTTSQWRISGVSQIFSKSSGFGFTEFSYRLWPWKGIHGPWQSMAWLPWQSIVQKKVNLPAVVFLETSSVSGIMCCNFFMVKLRCLSRKNGKTGMLGHPEGLCWLLWFLGLCSMFLAYL